MNLVSRPEFPPGECIVNYSSEDPRGYADLGDRVLIDPRVYVSYQAVVDLGRLFGIPSPEDHARLLEENKQLTDENQALKEENVQLNRDVEAAEWTLERKFQAKPQAKPGRPRKAA